MYIIISLSKPTECARPRVSPYVNYALWVTIVCQHRLIDWNKYTIVVVNSEEGCTCVGTGNMELSVLSS